jgi:predicted DNA-binding transcriptional regulator AlpA
MRLRSELTVEQIKEMLREMLEDFKDDLIEEFREGIMQPVVKPEPNDPLVRTAEVCLRWGRSRTTISKLVKAKKLVPAGRYGHSFTFRTSDVVGLFGRPFS